MNWWRKGGTSYGNTDEFSHNAVEDIVHPRDLHATILHQLGIDPSASHTDSGLDFRLVGVEKAHVLKNLILIRSN